MKYRLSQIAAVVGGRFSGTDCEVQSVVTDSRSLTCELGSGPVFVAMCGANHDSHAFVAQMYARGVRAFMVERPLEALPECGYVVVENAIAALQCLAAYHRAQFRGTEQYMVKFIVLTTPRWPNLMPCAPGAVNTRAS